MSLLLLVAIIDLILMERLFCLHLSIEFLLS